MQYWKYIRIFVDERVAVFAAFGKTFRRFGLNASAFEPERRSVS